MSISICVIYRTSVYPFISSFIFIFSSPHPVTLTRPINYSSTYLSICIHHIFLSSFFLYFPLSPLTLLTPPRPPPHTILKLWLMLKKINRRLFFSWLTPFPHTVPFSQTLWLSTTSTFQGCRGPCLISQVCARCPLCRSFVNLSLRL